MLKKSLSESSNKSFYLISILLILLFAVFSYMFPYSGDDWAWGSQLGIDRFERFFDRYNGRYFGNFLVLTITRNRLIRTILMSLSYYLVCFSCYKYAPEKKNSSLLLSAILFFVMPRAMFAQSIVWSSGYSNYVPSAIISVLFMLMVNNITGSDPPKYPKHFFVYTLLMGYFGAPFIENVALFNICLAIAVIGYTAIKFKKAYACHFGFLIGSVAGSLWMFSNSAYSSISSGTDSYRDISTSIIDLIVTAVKHIATTGKHLVLSNGVMCAIASVLLAALAFIFIKQSKNKSQKNFVVFALAINMVCCAYILYRTYLVYSTDPSKAKEFTLTATIFAIAPTFFYIITIFILPLICIDKGTKFRILLPLYCVPVVVAPLLVVNPIGPRCFFAAYLFMMVFIVNLFSYVSKKLDLDKKSNKLVVGSLCAGLCTLSVIYLSIFVPIFKYDNKRNESAKIQYENGENTIIIAELPYDDYVWMGEPRKELWIQRYNLFHDIGKYTNTKVVPEEEFDEFYETYQKE